MAVLVACKNEEDPIRNEGAGASTTSFPLYSRGIFSNAQGQLSPQSIVKSC